MNRGVMYYNLKKYKKALRDLKKFIELFSHLIRKYQKSSN